VEESPLATGLAGTGLLKEPLRAVGGRVRVPTAPGLGIELDDDLIARYRIA
jgi:L-alanine-DL-glutamate epimerase-like enolase superfamily enzyme